jgi:SET domain-containing protein
MTHDSLQVARFLNHCCEPNLFVQSVFIEYAEIAVDVGSRRD